jgi:type I restriction enzyme M protein
VANGDLGWIANFIWGIADDVLRDLYVRGKYRDVILPMTVLRRLDALLEPTKKAVLNTKTNLDKARITNQDAALRAAAGQAFYNTSKFTLRDLRNRGSQQQLRADFEAYLDGFSPNVQEILENFEFRNQIPRLSKADALGTLIEKFLDPALNVSPDPVVNADGSVKHNGLDNHAMGTIFEELVRRFNEENNEEAGEHWTPRDAVKLMANLIFAPIAKQIESGTYLLYDGALGTGGMLTVAEETLQKLAKDQGKDRPRQRRDGLCGVTGGRERGHGDQHDRAERRHDFRHPAFRRSGDSVARRPGRRLHAGAAASERPGLFLLRAPSRPGAACAKIA